MSEVGKVAESLESFDRGSIADEAMQQNLEARIAAEAPVEFTRSPEAQETFDSLVAYYGDTQFEWGGHVGNISFVLESCPIGQMKIAQGFDAVISWADRRKVVVEELEEEEEQKTEDVVAESAATEKTEKISIVEKTVDTKQGKSLVEKTEKSKVELPAEKVPFAVATVAIAETPLVEVNEDKTPLSTEVSDKAPDRIIEKIEPIHTENGVAPDAASVGMDHETIVEKELDEPTVQAESAGVTTEPTEEVVPVSVLPEVNIEEEQDEQVFAEIDPFVQDEITAESAEYVEVSEERDLADEIESWTELAEQEVPLDEFFVTVIDQLHVDADLVSEFEDVLFDDVREVEIESLAVVELETLIVEVLAIKAAMKKLHGATSRHECETHVDETVVALVNLLRALGYENPEKIIRDFMYAHPLSTLEELMNELELSIQRSIRYEVYRQKQRSYGKRHAVFGRLVLSFLQALSPKGTAVDLAS